MTLEDLRVFISVAKTCNLTVSSKELYKSESALSKSIKRLEKEIGISLFYMERNRLHLTPEGIEVSESAKRVFEYIDRIMAVNPSQHRNLSYEVYSTDVELMQVVYAQTKTIRSKQGVHLNEHYASMNNVKLAYERGDCDLAITTEPIKTRRPSVVVTIKDSPVLVCKKGTIKTTKDKISLKDIKTNTISVLGKSGATINLLNAYAAGHNLFTSFIFNEDTALFYAKMSDTDQISMLSSINARDLDKEIYNVIELNDSELSVTCYMTFDKDNKDILDIVENSFTQENNISVSYI